MAGWRALGSVVAILAVAGTGNAAPIPLVEAPVAGKFFRIELHMELAGEIRVEQDGKKVPLKQTARADHVFLQRVLDVAPNGLARKCAHYYTSARAVLAVGTDRTEATFRPGRRLLVAQRFNDEGLTYAPAGPLTNEERELTEHFDTLSVTGLLAGKPVEVGATWKVPNAVVQALCGFEGLTSQDLTCKLDGLEGTLAVVSFKGKAAGIDLGAQVKLTITGTYRFDLKTGRLTRLEWHQKDDRDQGPASPISTSESTTTMTRTPVEAVPELSDVTLVSVPDETDRDKLPPPMVQIDYRDPRDRYVLLHTREWRRVGLTDAQHVLRLMDHGDFVAQVTITPWKRAQPGEHLSPEAFQEEMANSPGWEQDEVLQADGVPSDEKGRWVYRVSALGELDGVKVMQNFYLVAGPGGEQVVLAFTMTPAQAQKIGTRDLALVGSLHFPAAASEPRKPRP